MLWECIRFKTKSQEPRFAQESLGNLGSWFLVLVQEIPRFVQESWGNLGSWFLVLVRKFQDLFRSPGEILVLGFGSEIPRFVQESWGNLGSWF